MFNQYIKRETKIAIITSASVFLGGFFMMNLFWLFMARDSSLPGLYSFNAAKIGDPIFLPMILGSLSFYAFQCVSFKKADFIISFIFGLAFAGFGLSQQLDWLRRDDIALNWTITAPHVFNAAGIAHAIFFITMFFGIGVLLSLFIISRKRQPIIMDQFGSHVAIFVFSLSMGAFLSLWYIDDFHNTSPYPLNSLPYIIILFLFIVVLLLTSGDKNVLIREIQYAICGLTCAYGFGLMFVSNLNANSFLPWVAMLFAASAVKGIDTVRKSLFRAVVQMSITFFSYYCFAYWIEKNGVFILLGLIFMTVPIFSAYAINHDLTNKYPTKKDKKDLKRWIMLNGSFVFTAFLNTYGQYIGSSFLENILQVAMSVAIGGSMHAFVMNHFEPVKQAINANYKSEITERKRVAYFTIISMGVGAILYILLLLSKLMDPLMDNNILSFFDFSIENSFFLIPLLLSLLILNLIDRGSHALGRTKVSILFLILIFYSSFVLFEFNLRQPFYNPVNYTLTQIIIFCLATYVVFGATLFVVKCYLSSIVRRVGKEYKNKWLSYSAPFVYLCILAAQFFAILPPIDNHGIPSGSIFKILFSVVLLAIANTLPVIFLISLETVHGKVYSSKLTEEFSTTLKSGIIQDGAISTLCTFLGAAIPIHIASITTGWNTLWMMWSIVSITYWVLSYCLKNNVEHYQQHKKLLGHTNDGTEWLYAHVKMQNIIMIVTLFPYAIAIFMKACVEALRPGDGDINDSEDPDEQDSLRFFNDLIPRK